MLLSLSLATLSPRKICTIQFLFSFKIKDFSFSSASSGLFAKKLGLDGTVDEVADVGGGLVVVENKFMKSPMKPHPGHVYQAVAYAMLAEEALHKPVRRVMVRYLRDGKSFEIPVTEDLKRHVLWTVSKIKSIIEEEKAPRESNQKKCRNCGYRKICKGI
jgi:CRISPR-associated exonuclease Cas4